MRMEAAGRALSLSRSRTLIAGVGLLTLLAFGFRFFRITHQSLWTDEVSSIRVAQSPLDQIGQQSAIVNNSLPTYFLILRLIVGDSRQDVEFRARALSAVAGALSVPLFVALVFLWRGQRGGALLAGLLLAVNPLHLWYSQEVRAYALMLFFGLLALLGFELSHAGRSRWGPLLYNAAAIVALSLHKTALIFVAACIAWQVWDVVRKKERVSVLLVHAPTVLAGLVVLSLKSYPPGEGYGRASSLLEIGYTFMTFIGGYSYGPSLTDIQSFGPRAAVAQNWVQVTILLAVLGLVAVGAAFQFRRVITGRETVLLLMGIDIVAVYALFSGFPYNIRYALPALFGFLALLVAMATDAKGRKATLAAWSVAAVLLVAVWADAQWFCGRSYRKGDSRAVAEWLVKNQNQIASWTVLPGYLERSVEWYLHPYPQVLSRSWPPKADRTTSFPPVPDVLIIGRRHHLSRSDELIASYREAAGGVRLIKDFAGFELYVRNAENASR